MDFDIVQILHLSAIDIQDKPLIGHIRHYGQPTATGGAHMHDGTLPTGTQQPLYFADDHPSMPGWFKGMETVIRECGLWPEQGLAAQCRDFHCTPGHTDCCCQWLLFTQPDFEGQKSQLQELIESWGHICDFYPKYHCKLNFIEQYWGAAKF
jgi:hypothetical protein